MRDQHSKPSRWPLWARSAWVTIKYSLTLAVTVAVCVAVSTCYHLAKMWIVAQYAYARERLEEKLTTVKVIESVRVLDPDKVPVEELITQLSADAGLNPLIIKALAIEESGHYLRTDRIRYEDKLMSKVHPPKGLNLIEQQMYASSIGLTQIIYGLWKDKCKLNSFSDLLDPRTNIQCSIEILKLNLAACSKIEQPGARLREALRRYNGSGPDAEAYADRVMQRLADMLLLNLGDGV